ncbi:hypothetical protein Aca07nite_64550 [Actinoplanes capillaceus]|uniref:Secreted protein n=1 Tax=Actinoplanes campanulatus TaxID=113559 RepID=A0ABQ3WSA9_9ACTN|nr:hypothetical protein [Actinoplanes capillaceus]GID49180.1 hypothetical protein Aca07nite_64550 [Actinoplanes capillaceus]
MLALIMRLVTVALVLTCATAADHMRPHEPHDHSIVSTVTLAAATADGDVLLPARTAGSQTIADSRGGEQEHTTDACEQMATPPQTAAIVVEFAHTTVDDACRSDLSPGRDLPTPASERRVLLETGVCRT